MTNETTLPADRELLTAYTARADQGAFAELVRRHGPLVFGACQRILGDRPDADDAFQAVFLVLARRAASVREPGLLGNWLYGVALRCAKRARVRTAERWAREQTLTEAPTPAADTDWADLRPVLDEEIGALPEKLRSALVLCELQGLDRAEAAETLGVPEGTLSSRLARAKDALRSRLVRRGVTLSAVGLGLLLANLAPAAVPPELTETAVSAATGQASTATLTLANSEVNAMFWSKVLRVGLAAAVLAAVGLGSAVVGYRQAVAADDKKTDKEKLQGEWKVVSAKVDARDAEAMVGSIVSFSGDTVKTMFSPPGAFKLDETQKPRHFDVTITEGRQDKQGKYLGLYKLEGDKMTMHISHPDGARPADFENKDGEHTILMILERVK